MTKFCSRCNERKPWTDFYAALRDEDGTMVRPGSYCKPCCAELRRIRRREDPAWARMVDQRDRARINADPARLERRRELQRENSRVYRLRHSPS